MKKLSTILCLVMVFLYPIYNQYASAEAVVKKVCHDKIDPKTGKPVLDKDGKPVQECKEIKTHKKLEGTEIPTSK